MSVAPLQLRISTIGKWTWPGRGARRASGLYQWMMEKGRRARLANQERLRELKRAHGSDVTIFSGHDPEEFERAAGRPLGRPAEPTVPSRRAAAGG
jgi:hypothetical protein